MEKIKFIHTSDLQLGMKGGFLKADSARVSFDSDRLGSITKLGRLAQDNGCSFIVMAGDVFDSTLVEDKVFERACERFKGVPVPIYLLPGNHDHLVRGSILYKVAEKVDNCHLLADSDPVEVCSPEGEVEAQLVGAPLTVRHPSSDLVAEAVSGLEPTDKIRIVVGHGQPTNKSFGSENKEARIDVNALTPLFEQGVIDYLALGDTHSTEEIAPGVWFSGAPEATDFRKPGGKGESDSGNALIVSIEKLPGQRSQVSVEKKHIGSWRFEELERGVSSQQDVDELLDYLGEWHNKEKSVVKCRLSGSLTNAAMKKLLDGFQKAALVFGSLYERDDFENLDFQPTDEEIENSGVTGYAREALEDLIQLNKEGNPIAKEAALALLCLWSKLEEEK